STPPSLFFFFFSTAPAPPELYPLSLHDALPISQDRALARPGRARCRRLPHRGRIAPARAGHGVHHRTRALHPGRRHQRGGEVARSEEHTSELQSRENLVCRLLLEKKKYNNKTE